MPGLIRGVARTAVVAGTATAVSNNVSRRQANRWAEKEQAQYAPPPQQYAAPPPQYAPPPQQVVYAAPPAAAPAAPEVDIVAELTKLGELKGAGVLTDAEFEAAKAKLLA
jgi:hypothetical protein